MFRSYRPEHDTLKEQVKPAAQPSDSKYITAFIFLNLFTTFKCN